MADVYEKDLAQKTSLTASDFIRMVGSDNVSYKQTVNSVKDLFNTNMPIRQMTSSSFANLDTQIESISGLVRYISATAGTDGPTAAKNTWTVLGYRNSTGLYAFQFAFTFDYTIYVRTKQNSQTWSDWDSIPRTKNIGSGDDLNNYHGTGFYVIATGSNNVANCPSGYCGLLVLGTGTATTSSAHQLAYSNSGIWKRSYTGNPIAWTDWEKMPTRAEIDAVSASALIYRRTLTSADDCNTLAQGVYVFNTSIPQNAPSDAPYGTLIVVSGTYGTSIYNFQLLSTSGRGLYYRRKQGQPSDGFSAWTKVTGTQV